MVFKRCTKNSLAVLLAALTGCAALPKLADAEATPPLITTNAVVTESVMLVQNEELATPEQPSSMAPTIAAPEPLPAVDALTVEALEESALLANPLIAQVTARICALRGKWLQVGLPPNPTIGYLAGEVGNGGAAGQQGAYVGQNFIRGNKLQRNRDVVSAEIRRAEQQLAAAQQRVRTDVRKSFYGTLLAQRRVELADELVRLTSEAVEASQSLLKAEEIPLAGLLQSELQEQNAHMLFRTSQNRLEQAWRSLSAVLGVAHFSMQPLVGDVSNLPESLEWQHQLERLQSLSPEMSIAMADITRARLALRRACVEAVPDISAQLSVQYDDATQDTVTGIQIGMPLPIWNRNQGGIRQAKFDIIEAVRNADRVELDLARRLSDVFRTYSDARITAETYATEILPRAERTFKLVQQGYQQGEVGYLDSLVAQQTFSQTNLAYLDALSQLWRSHSQIDGLLLENSLANP